MQFRILSIVLLVLALAPYTTNAQTAQITVGGVLLNIQGQDNVLYQATIETNGLAISMNGGTSLHISAPAGRRLYGNPSQYVLQSTCNDSDSSLLIAVPGTEGPVDIHLVIAPDYCGNQEPTPVPSQSTEPTDSTGPTSSDSSQSRSNTVTTALQDLRSNQVVQTIAGQVTRPFSAGAVVIGAGSAVVAGVNASANLVFLVSQIGEYLGNAYFYIIGLLGIRKRRPWGRVINTLDGRGLEGVSIQVYEAEFKKVKDAQTTDAEGRFNGLIVPGSYFIKASKRGFVDEISTTVVISSQKEILAIELPLKPSTEMPAGLNRVVILQKIKLLLQKLNPFIVGVGALFSLFSFLIDSSRFNFALMMCYLVLACAQLYLAEHLVRPFGSVASKLNGTPLSLAVIRMFDKKRNILVGTHVSDKDGRFSFLLSPGTYYYTVTKTGFESYASESIMFSKATIANFNIVLTPKA